MLFDVDVDGADDVDVDTDVVVVPYAAGFSVGASVADDADAAGVDGVPIVSYVDVAL